MIVPMKKLCVVVQDASRESAMRRLREAGVVHLENKGAPLAADSNAMRLKMKVDEAMGLISEFKAPKKKKEPVDPNDKRPASERRLKPVGIHRGRRATDVFGTDEEAPYSVEAVNAEARPYLPDLLNGFGEERRALKEQYTALSMEVARIEGWGDFDPEIINAINAYGVPVYLYEISHDILDGLDKSVQYVKVKSDKAVARVVVFYEKLPGIAPFQPPKTRLSVCREELEKNKSTIHEIETKLKNFADRRSALKREMGNIETELEFEAAVAGMVKIDDASSGPVLSWLTGYAPKDDIEKVRVVAKENKWALSVYDPGPEDEVPTKLKKNKFASLLNPIEDFLGIVPGYREVDISPWFLIFFSIYFSMIFADGGYGLIMLSMAVFGFFKTLKKGVPLPLKMFLMLSAFSVTWGALTCSWFGVDAVYLPRFLIDISFAPLSAAKTSLLVADQSLVKTIVDQNKLLLCFSLGLVQLSIAHIISIFKAFRSPSPRILADIGSLGLVAGIYNLVLFLMVSNDYRTIPMLPVSMYLLVGGFALSFIFGAYETGIGQSILDGLKNIIGVVLGVTGVFGDIMSYIRLWAVAIAGAAISETVNTLAGPMLGTFIVFLAVILLIFGHGLNMILTVLSVLVHGVRLNILEFSTHVKLTWSGIAYKPFALKQRN